MSPRAPTPAERWIALGLFAVAFTVLFLAEEAVGFVRDESVYFAAAESYARWFQLLWRNPAEAFTDRAILRSFGVNREHPALAKSLFGLSYLLFHEGLGWLRPATAFRLPAFAAAALIPALSFLFGARLYGKRVGLFAAVAFLLVPRQLFHSQLAAFDVPVVTAWLVTVYCFWRSQTDRRFWLWTGLMFGLALATKHNALFLPFVLGPFALAAAWKHTASAPADRARVGLFAGAHLAAAALFLLLHAALGAQRFQARFTLLSPHVALYALLLGASAALLWRLRPNGPAFRALAPLTAMAALGPLVFYLHWPLLWHQPVERAAWYLAFHARHEHYTWFYLGELLRAPPFPLAYVAVKTALTVPTSLFVPMVAGVLAVGLRAVAGVWPRLSERLRPADASELLVWVNALAALLIISHPQVPHFGGVKHWLPSMPFLGLLAGLAVVRAADGVSALLPGRAWARPGVVTASLFALLWTPAAIATARIHPYGTSAYSELAGGLPGAASLGMQRQYWSNNVTGVLPWLNTHAPRGARLYLHEVNGYSFRDYQRNGMLRTDLRQAGGPRDAQVAAYQYHQEFREQEFQIWQAFGTRRPVHGLYVDETPQVVVYRRPPGVTIPGE